MEALTRIVRLAGALTLLAVVMPAGAGDGPTPALGEERSVYVRTPDSEAPSLDIVDWLRRGETVFTAQWTPVEGAGRPLTTGTGSQLADGSRPLTFPHNFNRVSARDANSCAGCHNAPYGIAGGGGDFVTGVFVAAQRFDFATFDARDGFPLRGSVAETGAPADLQTIGNFRATPGMFGAGFIEMLARQMTADLQDARDRLAPGGSVTLSSKGVYFGRLARSADGRWMVSEVQGLPAQSTRSSGPADPPSLVIHPFHQSGSVVSLRQFTNNAFNHHHGMQSAERFGDGTDPDGDGIVDELTRADITAATLFQAALPVPVVEVSRDPAVQAAVTRGRRLFSEIGCADCHRPMLPLNDEGWIYTEPNPYNPDGNLRPGDMETVYMDLTSPALPGPRLRAKHGVVRVPAYTDLRLHDITSGPDDPNAEAIDINEPGGSPGFFAGNRRFLTKKLWGAANEPPYFHHGLYTTLRAATLGHAGEALAAREAFEALPPADQGRVVEFLKSLRVAAPGRSGSRR